MASEETGFSTIAITPSLLPPSPSLPSSSPHNSSTSSFHAVWSPQMQLATGWPLAIVHCWSLDCAEPRDPTEDCPLPSEFVYPSLLPSRYCLVTSVSSVVFGSLVLILFLFCFLFSTSSNSSHSELIHSTHIISFIFIISNNFIDICSSSIFRWIHLFRYCFMGGFDATSNLLAGQYTPD